MAKSKIKLIERAPSGHLLEEFDNINDMFRDSDRLRVFYRMLGHLQGLAMAGNDDAEAILTIVTRFSLLVESSQWKTPCSKSNLVDKPLPVR